MKEETLDRSSISAPKDRKAKVLYFAGLGRRGPTILSRVVGQVEDSFPVGELRLMWDRRLIKNRPCGCGVPFQECPCGRR
jgi:hypothetical protein